MTTTARRGAYATKAEVAAETGLSIRTIERRLQDRTLPRRRLGRGQVLIAWADVDRVLKAS